MSATAVTPGELEPGLAMKQGMERGRQDAQIPGLDPAIAAASGGAEASTAHANSAESQSKSMSMRNRLLNTRGGQILTGAVTSLALLGANEAVANASETEKPQLNTTVHIGGDKYPAYAVAGGKVEIIANHRDKSVSRADIREARQDGNCKTFSPKEAIKAGIVTQGYNQSGVQYAPENRRSTICRIDGKLIRIQCGNRAKITQKPRPAKAKLTAWINNWNKAKIHVKSVANVFRGGECETPDGNASAVAYAHARGVGRVSMRWKNVARAGAKATTRRMARLRAWSVNRSMADLNVNSKAVAKAVAVCKSVGGKFTPEKPKPEQPVKDGTDTPAPPTEAPGPNPDPDPEEPFPGGHECYDEIDGDPVKPKNGVCPPGSVGEF